MSKDLEDNPVDLAQTESLESVDLQVPVELQDVPDPLDPPDLLDPEGRTEKADPQDHQVGTNAQLFKG